MRPASYEDLHRGSGVAAYVVGFWRSLSTLGLLIGTLFFAASLTPSLIPRPYLVQGVLSGFSAGAGYALGVFIHWLWTYLELPHFSSRTARALKWFAAAICLATAIVFLWKAAGWQNSVRSLMGLEPVETAEPLVVGLIALGLFAVLIALARLFKLIYRLAAGKLDRYIPRRLANVIGVAIAVVLFWSIAEGVLLKYGLRSVDASLQRLDNLIEDDLAMPTDPEKTGSAASLVNWKELGRQGRRFIASGPSAEDIGSFFGTEAKEPIRVYVGLNSADTAEERAKLALEEMKRVGAFDRSALVVAVPTGTGWMDPAAFDSLEYLHHGDVATVGLQYSYLLSWLSLLVEPDYGAAAGKALFKEVYDYWTQLPRDKRPKLYLHGLSLGALNSERSVDLFNVIGDPFQGALWVGPPFTTPNWNWVTANRNPGSPAWLPRFRDGSVIRFTNQDNALDIPGEEWGPMRIVYLQYASDPITFFEPAAFYREPEGMKVPRGPDVSPDLRWYPVITMLQLAFDMAIGTSTPIGHGHVYAPEHYIDGWMAVTDPPGVSAADVERLKAHLKGRY